MLKHLGPRQARSAPRPSRRHPPTGPGPRRTAVDGRTTADLVPEPLTGDTTVQVRSDLPRPLITVTGELDLGSAGLLTALLDHVRRSRTRRGTAGPDLHVDVDLSRVTFADSHGLAPVLDGRTRVVAASPAVRRVLRLLDDLPAAPLAG